MTGPTPEQVRESFEQWIKGPPYERRASRYPETDAAWPGSYRAIDIDLAWQAWQASHNAAIERAKEACLDLQGDWNSKLDSYFETGGARAHACGQCADALDALKVKP